MTWMTIAAVVAVLIGFNALYVAAEFATISSRRSRLAEMAAGGDRAAARLSAIAGDPRRLDAYVATCQVGITVSSLVLGFYGQGRVATALAPWLGHTGLSQVAAASIAAVAVLLLLTGLQVVLGELVPKNVGVRFPERLAILTWWPMRWSQWLLHPLVALFNGSGAAVLRVFGAQPTAEGLHVHRPEEIILLARESAAGGLLEPEERRLLENALRWRNLTVRQAMVPRTHVLAAPVDTPAEDLLALLAGSPHARLVVHEGGLDHVVGLVHLKDLLCMAAYGSVRPVLREPVYVPITARASEVFALLQRERSPVAVVLDEHGGTAGITSLDDLVEALFGDLHDEFDVQEPPLTVQRGGRRVVVRGDVPVRQLNAWLGLYLAEGEAETLGGLLLSCAGRIPRTGESLAVGDVTFRVERMGRRGVASASLAVTAAQLERLREEVR